MKFQEIINKIDNIIYFWTVIIKFILNNNNKLQDKIIANKKKQKNKNKNLMILAIK